jgi:diguanylate cyclase (GGDEF)-like protein/PAS domain S-box-containing protein
MLSDNLLFSRLLLLGIASALVTILYLRLGLFVIRSDPKSHLNRVFFLVSLALASWSFGYTLLPSASPEQVWLWFKVSSPGWTLSPSLLLHFFILLAGRETLLKRRWSYLALYGPGLFFFFQALRGPGHMGVVDFTLSPWGWSDLYGPLTGVYTAYLIFFPAFICYGLWLVFKWGRETESTNERKQARLIVFTGIPVLVLVSASGITLPWLGVRSIPEVAHLIAAIWILALRYSISRHRLLVISPAMVAQDILRTISDIVILLDREGRIVDINQAGQDLLHVERKTFRGRSIESLLHFEDSSSADRLNELLESDQLEQIELTLSTESARVPTSASCSKVRHGDGESAGTVLTLRDITKQKQAEEKLRFNATHDFLTRLPNRTLLQDRVAQAAQRAGRRKTVFALLIFDLDNFKDINDSYGHAVGDQILKEVARILSHAVRGIDTVCRLAGDEFVLLVEDLAEPGEVEIVLGRVLESIARPLSVDGRSVSVSGSIGISVFPDNGEEVSELLRKADLALYSIKQAGKKGFQFFDKSMEDAHRKRVTIEQGLSSALEAEELFLVYQPMVDLRLRRIAAVEALLRWNSPALGLVQPLDFIPVAEQNGLIVPIGEWVLEEACRQGSRWRDELGQAISISVNVSAYQLRQTDFPRKVATILEQTGLTPELLELELTESTALQDTERSEDVVARLVDLGVRIVIDDFGAGYSTLARLRRLPLHAVKIDRAFIKNVSDRSKDRALVATIMEMANRLEVGVVAEGVETEDQLETLRALSGNYTGELHRHWLQGFLFSKPVSPEQISELLRNSGTAERHSA